MAMVKDIDVSDEIIETSNCSNQVFIVISAERPIVIDKARSSITIYKHIVGLCTSSLSSDSWLIYTHEPYAEIKHDPSGKIIRADSNIVLVKYEH